MLFSPKPLAIGAPAPQFARLDHHSQTIYSDTVIAQGGFILHFYFSPLDKTSGRSLEALKAITPDLQKHRLTVLAMNPFDWEIQHDLAQRLALPFSLLYDPLSKTAKMYGASLIPTFFNHNLTYGIDAQGKIAFVLRGSIDKSALLYDAQQMHDPILQPV